MQLRVSKQNMFARPWQVNDKKFALLFNLLYFHSPHAYRLMRKTIALPTVRSLRYWLQSISLSPGLFPQVMSKLKEQVTKMSENEKLCSLLFDEMKIKSTLMYNREKDLISGFEDYGELRTEKIANQAFVLMLKGITKNWKQPIGYLLAHSFTPADIIVKYIKKTVQITEDIGLNLKMVICDQASSNIACFRKLGVTAEKPYFIINEKKIYCMYDVPHLMKTFRNNLMKYNFTYNGNDIKWSHIFQFFKRDNQQKIRAAPKLTEVHLTVPSNVKMKVRYATQVFSYAVASGIYTHVSFGALPVEAIFTAEWIKKLDMLFDACNSSNMLLNHIKGQSHRH